MPSDASASFDFSQPLRGDAIPLRYSAPRQIEVLRHLGEQPTLSADEVHTSGHAYRLPQGSNAVQVICLPQGDNAFGSFQVMEIGNRIAQARQQAQLTQTELASKIGVTRGLVGQWESHRKKPGRESLRKIAEVTLVSMDWLLTGDAVSGVNVKDPDALRILRAFMRMSERQRKNMAEFFRVSADVSREVEHQSPPPKLKQSVE